jgi:glucose/arabinose dehydrogenase
MKRVGLILLLAVASGTAGCSDAASGPASTTKGVAGTAAATVSQPPRPATTRPTTTVAVLTTATTLAASTTTTTTEPLPELLGLELELVAEIHRPLTIASAPGDDRLFVTQREGLISTISRRGEVTPFLDITDRVLAGGIEQGLLGLAFHPDFAANGRFYVYYSDDNDDTNLVEFTASTDRTSGDPATARQVLFIDQPTERHNAGMLAFGPDDYLYVAVGDGGDGGSNAQKPENVFGSILRIDVDHGDPYAIPPSNPFSVGGVRAPEVWVYGLRNPWRFSIDEAGGLVYIGDVGQESWEEVDVIGLDSGGTNLGWAYWEGSHCFSSSQCDAIDWVAPVVEYSHAEGCSVTGGYVYRGAAIPELDGHYFYSDWCQGWIRSFHYQDGVAGAQRDWPELQPGQVDTFGVDQQGELYLGTWDGKIYRLVPIRADR